MEFREETISAGGTQKVRSPFSWWISKKDRDQPLSFTQECWSLSWNLRSSIEPPVVRTAFFSLQRWLLRKRWRTISAFSKISRLLQSLESIFTEMALRLVKKCWSVRDALIWWSPPHPIQVSFQRGSGSRVSVRLIRGSAKLSLDYYKQVAGCWIHC